MASCLVSITGTSGSVQLNYLLSGIPQLMTGNVGDSIYINDIATSVTYTTLSGDAVASSLCETITALPQTCYIFSWGLNGIPYSPSIIGFLQDAQFNFTGVGLNDSFVSIPSTPYTAYTPDALAYEINSLNNPLIEAVAKMTIFTTNRKEHFLIVKTTSTTIPELRITNSFGEHLLYLKGVVTLDCLPSGYTLINTCSTTPAP